MELKDIESFNYSKGFVAINGVTRKVYEEVEDGIKAIQYHGGEFVFEEPSMKKVPLSKYQFLIDAWVLDKKEVVDSTTTLSPPNRSENIERLGMTLQRIVEDKIVGEYKYTTIDSIGKYQGYDNLFRVECEVFGKWIADIHAFWFAKEKLYEDENVAIPTILEIIKEMPQCQI